MIDYVGIAMDRLIYQTDTCRIFHFANTIQDAAIRKAMTDFPNQSIWRLEYDSTCAENYKEGYLIYHLRSKE